MNEKTCRAMVHSFSFSLFENLQIKSSEINTSQVFYILNSHGFRIFFSSYKAKLGGQKFTRREKLCFTGPRLQLNVDKVTNFMVGVV